MMVWGGLLYLRNFDIKAVVEFSLSRDRMIERLDGRVRKQSFRYIPDSKGRNRWMTLSAFYLWILSSLRRNSLRCSVRFESNLINLGEHNLGGILFEEGMLNSSDCRFVLDWITNIRVKGRWLSTTPRLRMGLFKTGQMLATGSAGSIDR